MSSYTTAGLSIPIPKAEAIRISGHAFRRRHIAPEAGHALEILGHAIEYLADEFVHEGGSFSAHDGKVEAVQLLMACNREVYFACPEFPSLRQRLRAFMTGHLSRNRRPSRQC